MWIPQVVSAATFGGSQVLNRWIRPGRECRLIPMPARMQFSQSR